MVFRMAVSSEPGSHLCEPSSSRLSSVLIFTALALVAAANGQTTETNWEQRFRKEAPARWDEYRLFAQQLQGSKIIRAESDGKPGVHTHLQWKANSDCRLLETEVLDNLRSNRGQKTVFGVGRRYSFPLQRRDPASVLVITSLRMFDYGHDAGVDSEFSASPNNNCILVDPYNNWFLTDLVAQSTFRVIRATPVESNGGPSVQIDFDNSHSFVKGAKDYYPIQAGTLVLDPAHYWSVRSARLTSLHGNMKVNSTIEMEIRDLSAKFPVPKRYVEKREIQSGEEPVRKETWVREFELAEVSPLPPDNEFTLSAFGLPEPLGLESRRSYPWYVWLALGTAAVLLVGVLIGWFKRRMSR